MTALKDLAGRYPSSLRNVDRDSDIQASTIGRLEVGYIAKWDFKDYENISYLFHRIRMANLLKDHRINTLLLDCLYHGLHAAWNDHHYDNDFESIHVKIYLEEDHL